MSNVSDAVLELDTDLELSEDMAWAKPEFNRGKVDAAGAALVNPPLLKQEYDEALDIINNWRSSHSFPLQGLKMTLLGRAKTIDNKAIIAQRLKRLASINIKLKRNEHMKLSQMHDIGGCRAVMGSVRSVDELVALYEASRAKNPHARSEFVKKYDYIRKPKDDGYRSVHLIYKYRSDSPKNVIYNGLRIEIQLRSRLQHAWATAVETVSIFTGQALKSNIGEAEWKRFFALMGSAIALREKHPTVPGTPTSKADLLPELQALSQQLKIEMVLTGWGSVVSQITENTFGAEAFLLVLDTNEKSLQATGFRKNELPEASVQYLLAEKRAQDKPELQTVLVSVNSVKALRSAYPNYYLDTTEFLSAVRHALEMNS